MQEIKIFVKIAVQYFKVYLEAFGVCIFCVLEKLQGRYFCNYAVLTAQLAKLGLEVLSARGFYYKLGIDTKTSALGRSYYFFCLTDIPVVPALQHPLLSQTYPDQFVNE